MSNFKRVTACLVAVVLTASAIAQAPSALYCDRIQKAFTPNGDGVNDSFSVAAQVLHPEQLDSFQLRVFDRWGSLVFETTDYRNAWNGQDKKKKPVKDGFYMYIVFVKDKWGDSWNCKDSLFIFGAKPD